MEQKVIEIIESIKPYLISDGGNIEFIKLEKDTVYVRLHGACAGCIYRDDTIKDFVLRTIQNEIPEIKNIINVEI